ncbi:putative peroxisomal biogenesis factor 10 [Drosophila ficusphila]|uniref:putative peroxisomal biogenesis factor 10 n=1 Tax=Drosophila ficusphila TaxID=30025 RepID=UPI0007E7B390|nr:putative peroxisomal biogenesis factor 10 [Drosophila ficusphila]
MPKIITYGAQAPKTWDMPHNLNDLLNTGHNLISQINMIFTKENVVLIQNRINPSGYTLCKTLHEVLFNIEKEIELREIKTPYEAILDEYTLITEPTPMKIEEDSPCFKCPLCLANVYQRDPVSTRCGHIFCGKCIQSSLKFSSKCPICQKQLSRKHIFRIYL